MTPVDLRSDTVTRPTPQMRRAMAEAEVGDDVYGEDPTVSRLQERAAELLGFEAALFVPSGTMGNQIALRLLARPGEEALVASRSHVVEHEMGAMSALSGILPRLVAVDDGRLTPETLSAALRPTSPLTSRIAAVALENSHNLAGGRVYTAAAMRAVTARAHESGLKVHVDGARVWNASVALGVEPSVLLRGADTAMACLSKGLCCPVGSLLFGSRDHMAEARRVRKLFGGGMRQAGVLAAAGLVALDTMIPRLAEDHEKARAIATVLMAGGVRVTPPDTNIVVATLDGADAPRVAAELAVRGVHASVMGPNSIRFVTHRDVSADDCERAARLSVGVLADKAVAGAR